MSAGLIMANKIFVLIIVGLILIAFYLISPYRYKAILNKHIEDTESYTFHTIILDTWTGESWSCLTDYGINGRESSFLQLCSRRIMDGEAIIAEDGETKIYKIPIIEGNK